MAGSITYLSNFNVVFDDVRSSHTTAKVSWMLRLVLRFVRWMEHRAVREYVRLYTQLEGLSKIVAQHPDRLTDADYQVFSKTVNMLSSVNELYRKVDFMESDRLKSTMKDTLNLAFDIEADIKKAAFSSRPRQLEGAEYITLLSGFSKEALRNKIA